MKENIKAPRHWPLCGEFTGTGEFPAQRASYAENVSIWWRHHVRYKAIPWTNDYSVYWRIHASPCLSELKWRSHSSRSCPKNNWNEYKRHFAKLHFRSFILMRHRNKTQHETIFYDKDEGVWNVKKVTDIERVYRQDLYEIYFQGYNKQVNTVLYGWWK